MHENQHEGDGMTDHERQAYELGAEHAKSAASWATDGNLSEDHYRRMIEMFDAGDPEVYDYLPAEPNLSGEWADGMTPDRLYEEITGCSRSDAEEEAGLASETLVGVVYDALCDAYERGVSETFATECERLIRSALES